MRALTNGTHLVKLQRSRLCEVLRIRAGTQRLSVTVHYHYYCHHAWHLIKERPCASHSKPAVEMTGSNSVTGE